MSMNVVLEGYGDTGLVKNTFMMRKHAFMRLMIMEILFGVTNGDLS